MKMFFLLILFMPAVSLLNATDKITETVSVNNSSQIAVEQTSLTIPSGFTYSGTNPSYTSFAIYTNMGVLKDSIQVGVKKEDSAKTDTTIDCLLFDKEVAFEAYDTNWRFNISW